MKDDLSGELERLRKEKRRLESRNKLQDFAGVCNQLGGVLFQLGRFEEAREEHLAEATASEALGDTLGLAVASRKIGECHAELGQYTLALSHQRKHLELAQRLGNLVEEQRAWATIGRTHLEQSETAGSGPDSTDSLNLAEKAFHRSLNVCTRLQAPDVGRVELARMRGRLYLNLGLVSDNRGNVQGCHEFGQRALRVHQENNCLEDLVQTHHSIALIHKKHGRHEAGLQHAEESLNVAKRLGSDTMQATALTLVGDLCLLTGQYERAVVAFRRAYKLTRAHGRDRAVRRTLGTTIKLCQTTKALNGAKEVSEKLSLYEKMGDMLCDVWCFARAVDSYLAALDCGRMLGRSSEQLAPLYVSLATTYADAKEYVSALEYYALELECREGNCYEQCRTMLNMADCEERLGTSREVFEDIYERALVLAMRAGSARLERRCLQALLEIRASDSGGTNDLEERLAALPPDEESDGEGREEAEEDAAVQSDGSSGLISGDEEEEEGGSDAEDPKTVCHVRRSGRRGTYRLTRNKKGETPLHLACIAGNVKLVKKLIEEGHPVNERDNCGWLPLHEAANQDFREVTQVLLANGARLNDRGGDKCEGVTPMHDAATNGHVEMVRLLVEAGALLTARTDRGESVVHCLRAWRQRAKDDTAPHLLQECRQLESELERRIVTETGVACDELLLAAGETESPLFDDMLDFPTTRRHFKTARTALEPDCRDSIRVPALLEEDRLLPANDDWLLDDMASRPPAATAGSVSGSHRPPHSKRRRCDVRSYMEGGSHCRRTPDVGAATVPRLSPASRQPTTFRRHTTHEILNEVGDQGIWVAGDSNDDDSNCWKETDVTTTNPPSVSDRKRRRRRNSSTDRNGSDRFVSGDDGFCATSSLPQPGTAQNSTPNMPTNNATIQSSLRIKVKVLDKLLLIPVPSGETVAWLAREAAQRYYAMFGLRPLLLLSTRDGALLCHEDAVDNVLSTGEEVNGQLQSYELPPLVERYDDASAALAVPVLRDVRRRLERVDAELVAALSDLRLRDTSVRPVLKALQCQASLRELILSGNLFRTQGLEVLASALQHLPGLRLLDLSNNDITDSVLGSLVQPLTTCKDVPKLDSLNLGFNPLLEEGCEQLSRLLGLLPTLTSLLLPSLQADPHSGAAPPAPHLSDALGHAPALRDLNVAHNRMPEAQLRRALDALQPRTLLRLDLGATTTAPGRTLGEMPCRALARFLEHESCALKELAVNHCGLRQEELELLLPALRRNRHLQILDLTGNPIASVPALLDEPSLNHLKIVSSYQSNRRRDVHEAAAQESQSLAQDSESLEDSVQWPITGNDDF